MRNKTNHTPLTRGSRLTDAKLLLIITICVFVVMYLCAVLFLGSGFKKPQTFFNILNENAALLILSCGMSLVMITGGIDISVGTLTALVCMSCAVNLDYQGGTVLTAILLALGIGMAFGFVQGFLIAYLEIQPHTAVDEEKKAASAGKNDSIRSSPMSVCRSSIRTVSMTLSMQNRSTSEAEAGSVRVQQSVAE